MRDTISLISLSGSLGFIISPDLLMKLDLDIGDVVEFEIFEIIKGKKPRKISVYMTRKIFTIGGGSKGVVVKHYIVKEFELKAGDILSVNIKGEKELVSQ